MGTALLKTKDKKAQFPVDEFFRNFLFAPNGDIWVAYVIEKTYFPLNDSDFFIPYVDSGKELLAHDEYEYHIMNIPTQFMLKEHISTIKDKLVNGELSDVGDYYYDEAEKILSKELETSKYTTFILVKLNTIEIPATPLEYYQLFKNEVSKKIKEIATGIPATSQVAPSIFIDKESELYHDMLSQKQIRRAKQEELEKVMYYFFHRNKRLLPNSFSPQEMNEGIISMTNKGFIKIEHIDSTCYLASIPLIEMPSSLLGSGFINEVQTSCYFPIETQIRIRFDNKARDISHVRKMYKRIKGQIEESDMASAELDDDEVILEGDLRLKQLNRDLKREDRRIANMSIYFVISCNSEEELEERYNHLTQIVKGTNYKIYRPVADQLTLFHMSLFCNPYSFRDYELKVTTGFVIDLGLDLYRTIGNEYGFPLGRGINHVKYDSLESALLFSNQLVFFAPQLAKKNINGSLHKNGNTLISGPSGQGKSTLIKYIFMWQLFFGQRTLYIDPKNEMIEFVEPALQKYAHIEPFVKLFQSINFITLSDDEKNRGVLDPLILLKGERARTQAEQILFQLGQVNLDPATSKKYKALIVKSIETIIKSDQSNNLTNVIETIKQHDDEFGTTLESFKKGIGKVLIGNDDSQSINLSAHATVLGIQGLNLMTEKEKLSKDVEGENLASEAVMEMCMNLVEVFSRNKNEDGMVIYDEAKGFTETVKGARQLEDSFRKGRANNTDVVALTQSHSDNDSDTMSDLISYKFAFRPSSESQQKKVLEFFGLKDNQENLEVIKGLKQGTCLFQDHMGRNQPIAIDVLFTEWLEAIKTTNTENEYVQNALALETDNYF